mmetsp:Transcript_5329/g.14411  ORF Transcript_5329/g.14411 Transcript_5329/m.14411 type:complete len:95 (+) Transcript_5329:79-363(+)
MKRNPQLLLLGMRHTRTASTMHVTLSIQQKKVKMKQDLGDFPRNPAGGKQANRFERIQQGIMSFGRGRQKGYNGGSKSPQNRKRHKGNKGKMRR